MTGPKGRAPSDGTPRASRRGLLAAAGALLAAAGGQGAAQAAPGKTAPGDVVAFRGVHQAGIVTPQQKHCYFAAFDLTTGSRDDVIGLLRAWTLAAARLTSGQTETTTGEGLGTLKTSGSTGSAAVRSANPAGSAGAPGANSTGASTAGSVNPAHPDDVSAAYPAETPAAYPADAPAADAPADDSADVMGLPAARLTLTFGFGAGLFSKDGKDRYGLAEARPDALIDLPRFNGDQLIPEKTGGDLSVLACADDPQVAFHAIRQLARLASDAAELRWTQTGFSSKPPDGSTPRNLMGFKDGTRAPADVDKAVWVGEDGPAWMRGGTYLVVRRIRVALEHWDRSKVSFQEQTMGRHKYTGAPLGLKDEFEPLGLDRTDADENPVIPQGAHVRLGNAVANQTAEILRRGYAYNDGVNFTAERWPPWRQGLEYDAGLLFMCYQTDPRTGFVKLFAKMARLDMLNQFVTHTGSGLFACPAGVGENEFIGQRLFEET